MLNQKTAVGKVRDDQGLNQSFSLSRQRGRDFLQMLLIYKPGNRLNMGNKGESKIKPRVCARWMATLSMDMVCKECLGLLCLR